MCFHDWEDISRPFFDLNWKLRCTECGKRKTTNSANKAHRLLNRSKPEYIVILLKRIVALSLLGVIIIVLCFLVSCKVPYTGDPILMDRDPWKLAPGTEVERELPEDYNGTD